MPLHGVLDGVPWFVTALAVTITFLGFGFLAVRPLAWTVVAGIALYGLGAPRGLAIAFAVCAVLAHVPWLRRPLITWPTLKIIRGLGLLPAISETERTAIESGDVWMDGELFSGQPNFTRLLEPGPTALSEAERTFLDGPLNEVCRSVSDWDVHCTKDLPPHVWDLLKEHRFFGLGIPTEYGGLGFSAAAHSEVVGRLSTRSIPLAITVMVPNSLGPAELLLHEGTDEQKQRYLPRLARGEEIPCFALTEPEAGSDAGSLTSEGVVFRDDDGNLCLRLSWDKRYITLAAVSTLLGLAFRLRDPEQLLGGEVDRGITCALIPTDTPGVVLGRRHDPMGLPFYNCPTSGQDVVVSLDQVIGGAAGVGRGWKMLMDCLAAGRGISLPAVSAAGTQWVARVTGAYAAVRRQFGLPIGKFEGLHEPLARIGGSAWLLEAARRYTCAGLDAGHKPPVVTALVKYRFTEMFRTAINDGMDVVGGAGISRGPNNLLAHLYLASPINITVEGANILTRTLMVFGQGSIRCHPYVFQEIQAIEQGDVRQLDASLWPHVGHVVRNGCRALLLSATRGRLARVPGQGVVGRAQQRLAWASATFAFWTDVALGTMGGALKRRETLTGRFSDVLSWMYLAQCALHRYDAHGQRTQDRPFLEWSLATCFSEMQNAFDGIYANFDVPVLRSLLRGPVGLWSRLNPLGAAASDALVSRVATRIQVPGETRDAVTPTIYLPRDEPTGLARLERAFQRAHDAEPALGKVKAAVRRRALPKRPVLALLDDAMEQRILTNAEADLIRGAEEARREAISVDSFTLEEYRQGTSHSERANPHSPRAIS